MCLCLRLPTCLCVCPCTCTPWHVCGSLLPLSIMWVLETEPGQTWRQAPLRAEPCCRPPALLFEAGSLTERGASDLLRLAGKQAASPWDSPVSSSPVLRLQMSPCPLFCVGSHACAVALYSLLKPLVLSEAAELSHYLKSGVNLQHVYLNTCCFPELSKKDVCTSLPEPLQQPLLLNSSRGWPWPCLGTLA